MGAIDCPICEAVRHINDDGRDRCWACGWPIPIDRETGEYLPKSQWPAISEQERRERRRHAEKVYERVG